MYCCDCYDYCYYCVCVRERETAASARAAHEWRLFVVLFPQTSREKVYTSSHLRAQKEAGVAFVLSSFARKSSAILSVYFSRGALSKSSEE